MRIQVPSYPRPRGAKKQKMNPESHQIKTDEAPILHGYARGADGTKLFYSVEGTGRPLVFCYGLICSSLHWTYQVDYFKKNYRTIWFDYRGHQNSDTPKDLSNLTLENIAIDLKAVLDELDIRNAVLLGHSMGVNVVLEYFKQQRHQVAGMVLANGTAKRPLETLFRNNLFQAGFKLLKVLFRKSPELISVFFKSQKGNPLARTLVTLCGFNPHLTPQADIELYIEQVAKTDPSILMHLIEDYERCDATSWLHTVNVPTLIVAGEHDKLIPVEQQQLIHQLIPNSELEIIRHGSHCPQMDLPDLVNHKIENFLNRIGYGPMANPSKETASQSSDLQQLRGF
jgi:non-heme chloroperoxidase